MKRIGLITTLLLLLSACAGSAASGTGGADQQYTLRLNLKPGQQWTTITTQTQHQEASPMVSASTSMTSTSTMNYTVLDVDADGSTVMSMLTTRVRTDTEGKGMSRHTDSATDAVAGPETMLLNQPLTMTVTPQGSVTKYDGFDELITNMFNGMADGEDMPDDFKATMQPMVEGLKDSAKQSMGLSTMYPDQPVEIGDSWSQSVSANLGFMSMNINLTYTLREVTSEGLVIELHGTGSVAPASPSDANMGMLDGMKMDMTVTQDGEMVLDPDTYWIIKQHYTQVMEGTIGMGSTVEDHLHEVEPTSESATPEPATPDSESMIIPMKITITMDMQVQK